MPVTLNFGGQSYTLALDATCTKEELAAALDAKLQPELKAEGKEQNKSADNTSGKSVEASAEPKTIVRPEHLSDELVAQVQEAARKQAVLIIEDVKVPASIRMALNELRPKDRQIKGPDWTAYWQKAASEGPKELQGNAKDILRAMKSDSAEVGMVGKYLTSILGGAVDAPADKRKGYLGDTTKSLDTYTEADKQPFGHIDSFRFELNRSANVMGCLKLLQRLYISSQGGDGKADTAVTREIRQTLVDTFASLGKIDNTDMNLVRGIEASIAIGCQMLKGERHVSFLKEVRHLLDERGLKVEIATDWDGRLPASPAEINTWLGKGMGRAFETWPIDDDHYVIRIGADSRRGDASLLS